MNIDEEENDKLHITKTKMNCDDKLGNLPPPLDTMVSGSALAIVGHSGSGKTTLMASLLGSNKKKGIRQSFKKLFDNVVIVSPSLHTISSGIFKGISDEKKFSTFDDEALDKVDELTEEEVDDDETNYTLLILDDVSSQLKKNRALEKRLTSLFQNRRHKQLTIWVISQKFRDIPTGIRSNLSHFITYKPKTLPEMEAIYTEMLPFSKKYMLQLFEYLFKERYSFLFVDMSMRKSPNFEFYRKFNKLYISVE
jgi:ABC-type dipeptide/oligopeptide/nickel transport system ATPase component|tara:strand:- start:4741 stop:5496 length:756 start_codon:yes stop_codon:yes gene_type:complete